MHPNSSALNTHPHNLQEIFISYRRALIEVAARIIGCRWRAEDVVQDAFLKLGDVSTEHIRQPVHYLFRLVRNQTFDLTRRFSLELRYSGSQEEASTVSANGTCPEAALIQWEALNRIDEALDELPQRTRAVFEMHRINGQSQKEIAENLGVSTTLVNFMIKTAHEHCCSVLNRYEEESGTEPEKYSYRSTKKDKT